MGHKKSVTTDPHRDPAVLRQVGEALTGSPCKSVVIVNEQPLLLPEKMFVSCTFEVTHVTLEIDGERRSAALKVVGDDFDSGSFPSSDNPDEFFYWKREPLAYGSESIRLALPTGTLRTPDVYAISSGRSINPRTGREHNALGMWMEFLSGTPGTQWLPSESVETAGKVGAWQARFIARPETIPKESWLFSVENIVEHYVKLGVAGGPYDPDVWLWHPALAEWDDQLLRDAGRVWAERRQLATYLQQAPRVFGTGDAHLGNMARSEMGDAVIFDLACIGELAIGQEVKPLGSGIATYDVGNKFDHVDYAQRVVDAYVDGLHSELGSISVPEGDWEMFARRSFAARMALDTHWIGRTCDPHHIPPDPKLTAFQMRGVRLATTIGLELLGK